jgi:tRNA-splicing endonuclease subunit Sen54
VSAKKRKRVNFKALDCEDGHAATTSTTTTTHSMEETGLEPDTPSAGPSKLQVEGQNDASSDSGDEDAPDYSQLSYLAAKALQQGAAAIQVTDETFAPFIPKRGEKDFEPTGFEAQARALEKSRKAMFDVIRCERLVGSKTISIATWEPSLNRAVVELARGSVFSSMGVARRVNVLKNGNDEDLDQIYHLEEGNNERDGVWKEGIFYERTRSRLELLPEEVLYLIERGSLECRIRVRRKFDSTRSASTEKIDYDVDGSESRDWVPMSVQQAFATMLFKDDLTRERYQLYAYLKRLGYVIQRKSIADSLRSAAALRRGVKATDGSIDTQGIIADPQHPLRLVTMFDLLLYPLRRISQMCLYGLQHLSSSLHDALQWLRNCVSRSSATVTSSDGAGRGLLGIGGKKWGRYDEVFNRLRIVPSGHSHHLPSRPKAQSNDEVPEIFFYAWRPATRFKKTDPPLPEYRIAVVDARKTTLPSLYAFQTLMEGVPTTLTSEDVKEMDEGEQREWKRAQEEKKRNDESYGRGAVKKLKADKAASDKLRLEARESDRSLLQQSRAQMIVLSRRIVSFVQSVNHCFTLLPPGCASTASHRRTLYPSTSRPRPINVFPPLKAGRKSVIVAVNDCGTTSLLRFGESEFDRWRLAGTSNQV